MLESHSLGSIPMSFSHIAIAALAFTVAWLFQSLDLPTQSAKHHIASYAAPVPKESKTVDEREFEIADGAKMKFCWIPAGMATLGSPKGEKDRDDDETEHEYVTKGFWLGKNPVTQEEWKAVMGDNPSEFDGKKNNEAKGMNTGLFPVECVNWDGCRKFLEKVNKRDGIVKVFGKAGQFVLPHEDAWEYACRGGKGNKQAFYFGNELNGTQANCRGDFPYGTDKKGENKEQTTEVGSYAKNWPHPWGLCDMHGNVWQWCENLYEKTDKRTLRAGSWNDVARDCRSAIRDRVAPDYRSGNVGFRVCLNLEK